MCYVGGPRCSNSAIQRLRTAKNAYKNDPTDENLEARKAAYKDYLLTPKGLESLETWHQKLVDSGEDEQADAIHLIYEQNHKQRQRLLTQNRRRTAFRKALLDHVQAKHPEASRTLKLLQEEGKNAAYKPTRWDIKSLAQDINFKGILNQMTPSDYYAFSRLESKCEQEKLIDSLQGKELAEPGSQSAMYPRDENGYISEVYYASYGSNLSSTRLRYYIEGGKPPGNSRKYEGCRDKSAPMDDIPVKIPFPLHFALKSKTWNGGIGFVDRKGTGESLGRAYLVNSQQFTDIFSQESGVNMPDGEVNINYLVDKGSHGFTRKAYGTALHIGDYNGRPVVTFTNTNGIQESASLQTRIRSAADRSKFITFRANKASGPYLRFIGSGLKETYGLTLDQQITYFRGTYGCHEMSEHELRTSLKQLYSSTPTSNRRSSNRTSSSPSFQSPKPLFDDADELTFEDWNRQLEKEIAESKNRKL